MRALKTWLLVATGAALLALPVPAAATTTLTAFARSSCSAPNSRTGNSSVGAEVNCVIPGGGGVFEARSNAAPGSVGAIARGSTFSDAGSLGAGNAEGQATYTDAITFTKTDPNAPDLMPVSLNLGFGGSINAGAGQFGAARAEYGFSVFGFLGRFNGSGSFDTSDNPQLRSFPSGLGDGMGGVAPGPGGFFLPLGTPTVTVNFSGLQSVQQSLGFSVLARIISRGAGSSATADFSSTLEFPINGAVFNLPAGYTANAGAYLVDNRFVDPDAVSPIPEPAAWAMSIAGFGIAGSALRARRRGSRRSAHSPG